MHDAAIRVDKVHVNYPVQGSASRRILNGIDLQIESGEFVSIVGQTGCGKSTLLRLILGEERPTGGRVLVNGCERAKPDRMCGYVPQKYSLFPDKTVLDNVTFGLEVSEFGAFSRLRPSHGKRMREFRAAALRYLEHTGFCEADSRKYPHQLSGGMQQRVAIAQALILKPPILLMDEAFSALDPGTRSGMQQLIKSSGAKAARPSCSSLTTPVKPRASERASLRWQKTAMKDLPLRSTLQFHTWISIRTKARSAT
jgi:NitT/TauT family transport system ATP-binding protein